MRVQPCAVIMVVMGGAMVANLPASELAPELQGLLARELEFSPGELAELERGRFITHALDAPASGEIAVAGAVRVNAQKEALLVQYRDIAEFKRGPDVVQIGRFSDPPVLDDLAALTIDKDDMDLRRCRIHDCDVRLPAEAIGRLQREIEWTASDADRRAAGLFKQILFDHVRASVSGGAGRFVQYDDGGRPIRPLDSAAELLARSRYLDLLPGLRQHLEDPAYPLPHAEDFWYWSKEKFGLAPFITVTRVTIAPATAGSYVIASRDVYSSRYLDASLSVAIASDVIGDPSTCYLTYVNRSVANALRGRIAGLRRAIAQRRARSTIEDSLRRVKRRLEHGS